MNRKSPGSVADAADASLLGRRDFLGRATASFVAAASVGAGFVLLRPLWPRAGVASAARVFALPANQLKVGQVDDRLLAEHGVWLVRDSGGFYALSARCTHLGCQLRKPPSFAQIQCNCHGSLFSLYGEVLRGPATRWLERVAISIDSDGRLVVDPQVRYRRERGEWSQPGAYLSIPKR